MFSLKAFTLFEYIKPFSLFARLLLYTNAKINFQEMELYDSKPHELL